MKQFQYTVVDELGLHARPAGLLVKLSQGFESESTLTLARTQKSASLKKLLAVMALGVKGGDSVSVTVEGADEQVAAKAIEAWMQENLG